MVACHRAYLLDLINLFSLSRDLGCFEDSKASRRRGPCNVWILGSFYFPKRYVMREVCLLVFILCWQWWSALTRLLFCGQGIDGEWYMKHFFEPGAWRSSLSFYFIVAMSQR